ncbi:galactose oxidase [Ascodesmis nigricans]|uniref:Galactose oxidase n=1 Tax=Ascodesmis nigricans TaxID=341454 RepID=A0A4S2MI08_9PEZI|nr:galactose oxidase [Ascodesmis nigricans]
MTRIKRGPPLPDPATAPDVRVAPTNGMYWYKAPVHGIQPRCWRGHASALLGNNIYVFGGRDMNTCFSDLYVLDADAMSWSKPEVHGDVPPPLRAMTMTPVRNKLVIFGGGDGKYYQNDVWVFDSITCKFTQPPVYSSKRPWPRRAHAACYYKNGIYVFGGGDGVHAMNDVWRLDVTDLNKGVYWKELSPSDYEPLTPLGMATTTTTTTTSPPSSSSSGAPSQPPSSAGSGMGQEEMKYRSKPPCRGYHTASMIGSNLVIYGGSNGTECYDDVWVFNVEELVWKYVAVQHARQRLCHTATVVGSFLFIVAGHDNVDYVNDVLLLNLVTMTWDSKRIFGAPPSARGYHSTILYDSRLFVIGGYNGIQTFSDTYILELAVSSYYSQISQFTVVLKSQEQEDRQKGWREVVARGGGGGGGMVVGAWVGDNGGYGG